MGIHETIMRSAIADLSSLRQRGFAYGIFNTVYGLAWLAGSVTIGFLYQVFQVSRGVERPGLFQLFKSHVWIGIIILIGIVSDRLATLERDIEKKEKDVLPKERTEKRVAIIEKDVQILDGTVEEGDKVFHEICFACHGEKGEGDAFGRQFGTDTGQTVGPTLCGGALKNVSNNQLRKIITYGRTTAIVHGIDMPNWGETLSHREIGSIMIYLRKCNEIALERP